MAVVVGPLCLLPAKSKHGGDGRSDLGSACRGAADRGRDALGGTPGLAAHVFPAACLARWTAAIRGFVEHLGRASVVLVGLLNQCGAEAR